MIDHKTINMPCTGDTKSTIIGDPEDYVRHIMFVSVRMDASADDPTGMDEGMGTFHSLSHRHSTFNKECARLLQPPDVERDDNPFDEDGELIYGETDAVPLSYFEHGNCVWSVIGEGPRCQFDSVHFAGVWEPSSMHVEYADEAKLTGKERFKYMCDIARSACKTWTDWCNGFVYVIDAVLYVLRDDESDDESDYGDRTNLLEDACRYGVYEDDIPDIMQEICIEADVAIADSKAKKDVLGLTVGLLLEVLKSGLKNDRIGLDTMVSVTNRSGSSGPLLSVGEHKDGITLVGYCVDEQLELGKGGTK
ncbi:MAG: hypothetical protein D4S01_07385 [Dehalococcoidia bacterium]|nr:MAG: hypothetical protein D4S01_07385 [Dehalococcoidia bacterium]